jgi:hypothetical protein
MTTDSHTEPKRIQRRRTAGWRMPESAVYVGRPTRWGNPFPASYFGPAEAVRLYREWLAGADHLGYTDAGQRRHRALDGLSNLTGHNLACWCPPDRPCHADVLLALANPTAAPAADQRKDRHLMTTAPTPRQRLIDGLRDLAAFLEQHPEVPVNGYASIDYCVDGDDDTTGLENVVAVAELAGVTVTDVGGRAICEDTTHFYARRRFGPVAYEATYIKRREMDDYRALMSYSGTVRAATTERLEVSSR